MVISVNNIVKRFNLSSRNLSVMVFSLFFSWLLAFPFQGQILHTIYNIYDINPGNIIFTIIAAHFVGLLFSGLIIKRIGASKKLIIGSIIFCMITSGIFFFPPSILWSTTIVISSFLSGSSVAAWGFYLKSETPKKERLKTVADGLIYSNILMIALNMTAIHISPYLGLGLSIIFLGLAFLCALFLPVNYKAEEFESKKEENHRENLKKSMIILCLFIAVITINSGLMYQVVNPAYAHLEWLSSWYWAIPYIVALYIMKNLPKRTSRAYILYIAIAMIGFSFIGFMIFDRTEISYLFVNTLMLGACGVFDLFWWSILGEMLDLHNNPARILGFGLSANVLGVMIGGFMGNTFTSSQDTSSTLLALTVVCFTFMMLPPLHRYLYNLMLDHVYLTVHSEMPINEQNKVKEGFTNFGQLTEREKEIADLLLKGKTYKVIASELFISENTVKTHVKNIYFKLEIKSRTELIKLMLKP